MSCMRRAILLVLFVVKVRVTCGMVLVWLMVCRLWFADLTADRSISSYWVWSASVPTISLLGGTPSVVLVMCTHIHAHLLCSISWYLSVHGTGYRLYNVDQPEEETLLCR